MKYIYGPVKSRRLGLSLGVSLAPYKICDFDCIYCQLGSTKSKIRERKEYVKIEDILNELRSWLQSNLQESSNLNYITFSGLGEPTLNIKISELIADIKKITAIPVAVITNASLFSDVLVRKALSDADLVVPSLDAATQEVFIKIDRPEQNIRLDAIINGLIAFRKEFPRKIWLEVMLVRGVNDDLPHIRKLKEIVDRINPDKIQVNSPVRTTAEPNVFPVEKKRLEKIKDILGDRCETL
jgi:wyosine [tRNA(Phe)-imidazoG37] synthetase (radical SAM superfamily)